MSAGGMNNYGRNKTADKSETGRKNPVSNRRWSIRDLFVLEETKLNGINYLLVTDSEEKEAECYIFKEISEEGNTDAVYEPVEDETELDSLLTIFEQLLDDVEFV